MVKATILKLGQYKKTIAKKVINLVTKSSKTIKKRLINQARNKIISRLSNPFEKYIMKKGKFVEKANIDKKKNYYFSSSDTINLLCPDLGVGRDALEKKICDSVGGQCRLEIGEPIGWKWSGSTLKSSGLIKKRETEITPNDKIKIKKAIKNNGSLYKSGNEENLIDWESSCCWLCGLPLSFSKAHWEYKTGDIVKSIKKKEEKKYRIELDKYNRRGKRGKKPTKPVKKDARIYEKTINNPDFSDITYRLEFKRIGLSRVRGEWELDRQNVYEKKDILFKTGPPECEHKLPILLLLFFCAGPTSAKKITSEMESDTMTEVEAHGDSSIQDGSFSRDQSTLSVVGDTTKKFRLDPEYLQWKRDVRSCSYVWSHKVCNRVKNAMCFVRINMNDDGLIEYGIDEWRIMKWAQLIARNKPNTRNREFSIIFDDNRGDWEHIYNRAFKGNDEYNFFKHYRTEDGLEIDTDEKKNEFLQKKWEYVIYSNLITQVELIVDTLNRYPGHDNPNYRIKREFLWRNMILNQTRLNYYLKKLGGTMKGRSDTKLMTFYRNIKIMLRTDPNKENQEPFRKAISECQTFLNEIFPEKMDINLEGGGKKGEKVESNVKFGVGMEQYLKDMKKQDEKAPVMGKIPTSPSVIVNRNINESNMFQTNIKLEEAFSEVLGIPIKQNDRGEIKNKNTYLEQKNNFLNLLVEDNTLPGTSLNDVIEKEKDIVAFSFNIDFDKYEIVEKKVQMDDILESSNIDDQAPKIEIEEIRKIYDELLNKQSIGSANDIMIENLIKKALLSEEKENYYDRLSQINGQIYLLLSFLMSLTFNLNTYELRKKYIKLLVLLYRQYEFPQWDDYNKSFINEGPHSTLFNFFQIDVNWTNYQIPDEDEEETDKEKFKVWNILTKVFGKEKPRQKGGENFEFFKEIFENTKQIVQPETLKILEPIFVPEQIILDDFKPTDEELIDPSLQEWDKALKDNSEEARNLNVKLNAWLNLPKQDFAKLVETGSPPSSISSKSSGIEIDARQLQQMGNDIKMAATVPLPSDSDSDTQSETKSGGTKKRHKRRKKTRKKKRKKSRKKTRKKKRKRLKKTRKRK